MKTSKLISIMAALMLAGGVAAKKANALSFDYLSLTPNGIQGQVLNDDGMGPYGNVTMEVPLDDMKYITGARSPDNFWTMSTNQIDAKKVLLSFTPMYGGIQLNQGSGGIFGMNIDDSLFKADHDGQSYNDGQSFNGWVEALEEMELTVAAIGPETYGFKKATYTVGKIVDTGNTGGSAVPEPATMMLFGSGLLGLSGLFRRKNKQ